MLINLLKLILPSLYAHSFAVEEDGETVGTGNDARVALLERINDANDVTRAEELMDVNDDGTVTQFTAKEMTEEEQAAAEAALQKDPDGEIKENLDRALEEANDPIKFKIKVNGKEMELTQEELIARAQKVEAADQYLVEAKRIQREAEEASRKSTTVEPAEDTGEAARLEERRAWVRAIQMGSEDEAMAAIEKLQMSSRPTVDQNTIARTIDERLTFKEAAHWFETEYPDIIGDDQLRQIALRRDQELLQAGDKREYRERYDAIGKEIRTWKDGLVKAAEPKVEEKAETLDQKQTRKAAAPSAPKTAAVKAPRADADDEDGEEPVANVIAKMAELRGGSQRLRT